MEVKTCFFWGGFPECGRASVLFCSSLHPVKERQTIQTGYLKTSRRGDKRLRAQAVHLLERCNRVWNV